MEALSVIKGRTLTKLVWSLDFFYVSSGSKKGRREREKNTRCNPSIASHTRSELSTTTKKKQHHPIPSSSLPSAIGCWPSFPHNKRNVINKYSPLSPGQQTHTQDPVITRLDPIKCQTTELSTESIFFCNKIEQKRGPRNRNSIAEGFNHQRKFSNIKKEH